MVAVIFLETGDPGVDDPLGLLGNPLDSPFLSHRGLVHGPAKLPKNGALPRRNLGWS